jgi:hypothetical protein
MRKLTAGEIGRLEVTSESGDTPFNRGQEAHLSASCRIASEGLPR